MNNCDATGAAGMKRWCRECLTGDGLMWEVLVMLRIARLDAPRVLHHIIRSNMKDTIMFFYFLAFSNSSALVFFLSISVNSKIVGKHIIFFHQIL